MSERYLVYRVVPIGLGHVFVSIMNCAHYARMHGYRLGIDFRRFAYLTHEPHRRVLENFTFSFPSDLEVITDLDRLDSIYNLDNCVHFDMNRPNDGWPSAHVNDVIIVNGTLVDRIFTFETKFASNYKIMLKGELLANFSKKLKVLNNRRHLIGLYFRHGNGEYLDLRFDRNVFPDYDNYYNQIKDQYVQIAQRIADEHSWKDPLYFIASDNAGFIKEIKSRLKGAFSISELVSSDIWYRAAATAASDVKNLGDVVNDMWFLSICDFVIYSPSLFPQFAILNSETLSTRRIEPIKIPTLFDVINDSDPTTGVKRALFVIDKIRRRNRPQHLIVAYRIMVAAQTRAGNTDKAQLYKRLTSYLEDIVNDRHYLDAVRSMTSGNLPQLTDMADFSRRILSHNHNNIFAMLLIAQIYEKLDDLESAEKHLRSIIMIEPNFSDALMSLSRISKRLGKFNQSLCLAREAVASEPEDPHAKLHLKWTELLADRKLKNVALGRHSIQSSKSQWSRVDEFRGAIDGVFSGRFGFHTAFEDRPWWRLDLEQVETIFVIRIFNREDSCTDRIKTLIVELAQNESGPWHEVYSGGEIFGGVRTGTPLILILDSPAQARFVQLRLTERTALHIDQVEVWSDSKEI